MPRGSVLQRFVVGIVREEVKKELNKILKLDGGKARKAKKHGQDHKAG